MNVEEQIIGMEKMAAINFIHGRGMTVRIAEEEGVSNNLVPEFIPGRIDIFIKDGKVYHATAG